MEDLLFIPLTDKIECSKSSAHVRVSYLSASWSCDKEKLVLDSISFEVDQVQLLIIFVHCTVK